MGWDPGFSAGLQRGDPRVFVLEDVVAVRGGSGWVSNRANAGFLSAALPGGSGYEINIKSVRVDGSRLQPLTWRTTFGGWQVVLAGGALDFPRRAAWLRPGRWFRLRVAFAGQRVASAQTIAIGQLDHLIHNGSDWVAVFRDVVSSLRSRITTTVAEMPLFPALESGTVAAGGWVAGTGTLNVSGFTAPEKPSDENGLLYCEGSKGNFYMRWSAFTSGSPDNFTVSGTGTLGTTAGSMSAGDPVYNIGFASGHPAELMAKVLLSSSVGSGDYDVLPETWGYGLQRPIVDSEDIALQVAATSSEDGWFLLQDAPVDNGLDWLLSRFQAAGWFLTQRQGQLTVRGVDHMDSGIRLWESNAVREVTDYQIISARWVSHDPEFPVEYTEITLENEYGNSASTVTADKDVKTLPAVQALSATVYTSTTTGASPGTIDDARRRVEPYYLNGPPERIELVCADMSLVGVAPGDKIRLTTNRVAGSGTGDRYGYSRRVCTVWQVSPEWMRGRVTLQVGPDRRVADY